MAARAEQQASHLAAVQYISVICNDGFGSVR
jgi:hypothetical protein